MKNKKNIIIVAVAILIMAVLAVFFVTNKSKDKESIESEAKPSVNPVIESYKKQAEILPEEIKKDPKNAQLIHQYAVSLFATGKWEEAEKQYLKEIEINKADPVVYNNLGNVYRELKRYEEAVKSYEKSIEILIKDNPAYSNLANMYLYKMGDKNKAIEVYKKALEADPNNRAAKEGLARLNVSL